MTANNLRKERFPLIRHVACSNPSQLPRPGLYGVLLGVISLKVTPSLQRTRFLPAPRIPKHGPC